MSYNTIVPFPKKSDAPSENDENKIGDLDDIKRLVERTLSPLPLENNNTILIYIKVSNNLILFHYMFANH